MSMGPAGWNMWWDIIGIFELAELLPKRLSYDCSILIDSQIPDH